MTDRIHHPDQSVGSTANLILPASHVARDRSAELFTTYPELRHCWDGKKWVVSERTLAATFKEIAPNGGTIEPREFGNQSGSLGLAPYTPPGITHWRNLEIQRVDPLVSVGLVNGVPSSNEGQDEVQRVELAISANACLAVIQGDAIISSDYIGPDDADKLYATFVERYQPRIFELKLPVANPKLRILSKGRTREDGLGLLHEEASAARDKVAQREIAAEIGIFDQPRFWDVRIANATKSMFCAKLFDLRMFPVDDIVNGSEADRGAWIFENVDQGFAVIREGKNLYVVTENPDFQNIAERLFLTKETAADRATEDIHERLQGFVDFVASEWHPGIFFDPHDGKSRGDRRPLVAAMLADEHPYYLKSARTSGGRLVVRVATSVDGERRLESDSPDFAGVLVDHFKTTKGFAGLGPVVPAVFWKTERDKAHLDDFALRLVASMTYPIIEEEIPPLRLGDQLVEFRIILQREGPNLTVTGHYVKASSNDIAANISLGGEALRSEEVLVGLYRQLMPPLTDDGTVLERATEDCRWLLTNAPKFGEQFANAILARDRGDPVPLDDFALDVRPVWDADTQRLRFFLVEVQKPYGYTGLQTVDPEAAARVTASKAAAQATYDEKMYALFRNLAGDGPDQDDELAV